MTQKLSGSTLKLLALTTMLIDHTASHLLCGMDWALTPWLVIGSHQFHWYWLLRSIGRIAFPLFAFLIVEGYRHTHDRKRYAKNLFLFALISEIPWNLVHRDSLFYLSQNVFFTLLIGYLTICGYERYKGNLTKLGKFTALIIAITLLCNADYGLRGVAFLLLLHLTRQNLPLMVILGTAMIGNLFAGLAFLPIALYNGTRGFIQGPLSKYLFYTIYPLHLLLFWWLKVWIYGHG